MRGLNFFRAALTALFSLAVFVAHSKTANDDAPTLDEYLKQYRDLGLPLPPKDAPLVRYESGGGGLINGKVDPIRYSLGFLLEPGTKKKRTKVFWGASELRHSYDIYPKVIEPDPEAMKEIEDDANECLFIAIQCHSRGWTKFGNRFLEKFQKDGTQPARTVLTNRAWDYWEGLLTETGSDRALINERLKELMIADPDLDDKAHRYLLKSLELALVPSKATPGSIEAMIDDLVEYGANTGTIGAFEPEDRYWRLARKGFEAVPALIEHLDDERLTRGKMIGFNNFRSFHLRVQHVVSDLLQGLAGEEAGRNWLRRQQGYVLEKDQVKKWWDKARETEEEEYLVTHVLPQKSDAEEESGRRSSFLNEQILRVLVAKYPKNLPKLYRQVLDDYPKIQAFELAEAIRDSKLPNANKMELFLDAVGRGNPEHRYVAMLQIRRLDEARYAKLLLETLEQTPEDVEGEYWTCPEARYTRLAVLTNDDQIWRSLEKAAKRAKIGLRMELLNHVWCVNDDEEKDSSRGRARCLNLLGAFLDDASVRDSTIDAKKYDGPCAGFMYKPRLAVRDFVAMEMASLLEIPVELRPRRTAEEWDEIRNKVREMWKREQGREKESVAPGKP